MSKNTQLDIVREAANCPPYKQHVLVNAGQLLAEIEREYMPRPKIEVLDADDVPIRVGDTVWDTDTDFLDCPITVKEITSTEIVGEYARGTIRYWNDSASVNLTHKKPDSLERIEADALMASTDYCEKYGLLDSGCNVEEGDEAIRHCKDCGLTCETRMVEHILRRQREVLERGR